MATFKSCAKALESKQTARYTRVLFTIKNAFDEEVFFAKYHTEHNDNNA